METDTETPTATDANVIPLNEETETATATEADGVGPPILLVVASLLPIGLWIRRWDPEPPRGIP